MDKFVAIGFPEIQEYMELEGFDENSYLINDDKGLDKFGPGAYFVSEKWIKGK